MAQQRARGRACFLMIMRPPWRAQPPAPSSNHQPQTERVCACVHACGRACLRVCLRACNVLAIVRSIYEPRACTCVPCVRACVHACVHACMHDCAACYAFMCACVHSCMRSYVRTCVHAYMRAYCVHMHACVRAYADLRAALVVSTPRAMRTVPNLQGAVHGRIWKEARTSPLLRQY
jgi:hypothetical protein